MERRVHPRVCMIPHTYDGFIPGYEATMSHELLVALRRVSHARGYAPLIRYEVPYIVWYRYEVSYIVWYRYDVPYIVRISCSHTLWGPHGC